MMKAIVCTKYGAPEVLQLKEVEKPSPKDKELLIKMHATSVTSGDARIRRADPPIIKLIFGFKQPRNFILGVVVAGEVVSIGKRVTKFKVGDQVFGTGGMEFGAYAEYKCISEDAPLALKPNNLSFEDAATIPFGFTSSLHFLRKGNIKRGQNVLIYGASGALGTAAVQLAKSFGAEVTGVCSSANLEMVEALGADKVLDYTKEDFSISDERYDIIFDTVGKCSYADAINSLTKSGYLLLANAGVSNTFKGLWTSIMSNKKVIAGVAKESVEGISFLKELIEADKIIPVIDRHYALEQVPEAHAYVDKGHKKGNVIININHL